MTIAVQPLGDLNTAGSSSPSDFIELGDAVYFAATDATHGAELWKSDGTGIHLVKDINPDGSSRPYDLTVYADKLFFSANDGVHGAELWTSDGSESGTVQVKDIWSGAIGSSPMSLVVSGANLYFAAKTASNGNELWMTDGTEAGTVLVKDIAYGSADSNPSSLVDMEGTLYFSAQTPASGAELWKSTGSAGSTVMVRDIFPGAIGSLPDQLTPINGTLYFAADDGSYGMELWKSNGTGGGTTIVKDISAGDVGSSPYGLAEMNGKLYFEADDGALDGAGQYGNELWASDGSDDGTQVVKDIYAGTGSSFPFFLTNVNGTLYFQAEDADHGVELWTSDGTAPGTSLVKDLNPGPDWGDPWDFVSLGGYVFFSANSASDGLDYELWRTSGTEASTQRVEDIRPGTYGSLPLNLVVAAGKVFFSADDGTQGREPYVITVTNRAPTDLSLSSASIAENQPVGSVVGTFTTDDPDPDNTFTYALVPGEGAADNQCFGVDGDQLTTATSFDRQTRSSYSIRVCTTDYDGLSYEKALTITITPAEDLPPEVISIEKADSDPTNASMVHFTVTFSEPVMGVGTGAFSLALANTAGTIADVSGGGNTYTVSVTDVSGEGTLGLNLVDDDTILDLIGNPLGGPGIENGDFTGPLYAIDTMATGVPEITGITSDTGLLANGRITNDTTLTINGVADPDSTITVYQDGAPLGTTMVNGDGEWTFDNTAAPLAAGVYTFTAEAADAVGNSSGPSANFQVTVDTASPTVTVNTLVTKDNTPMLTGTVGDPGSGIAAVTVVVGGQTLTAVVNGTQWNAALPNGLADGTFDVQATATDLAGNSSVDTTTNELVVDTVAPGVMWITKTDHDPTNAVTVHFAVTFSEPVFEVDAGDFNVPGSNGASVSQCHDTGDHKTYTVTVSTGTGDGTLQLNLTDNGTIRDVAGNPLGGPGSGDGDFSGPAYSIDRGVPTVTKIEKAGSDPTNASSVTFTVTFSEAVNGVDTTDFAIASGGLVLPSVTSVTGTDTTYTVTVGTGSGSGTLQLLLVDDDTITNLGGTPLGGPDSGNGDALGESYAIDRSPPAVSSIDKADPDPTSADTVRFTIAFTEAVTEVDATDFSLALSGTTGTIGAVSGSGTTYTVTVNGLSGSGTLGLSLTDDDTIVDAAGNPLNGLGPGNGSYTGPTYTLTTGADITAPAVILISKTAADPTSASTLQFTVSFSESVTGVDVSDFALATSGTAGTIGSVTGSGSTCTVTVGDVSGVGTLGLNLVDDDTIVDAAGNPLGGPGTGNGDFAGPAYTILPTTTTVSLSTAVTPSVCAQPIALCATVTTDRRGGIPGGSVEFFDGEISLGTASLDAAGEATLWNSSLAWGRHQIRAVYLGDGTYSRSGPAELLQSVWPLAMEPDPLFQGRRALFVGGSNGPDAIVVQDAGAALSVSITTPSRSVTLPVPKGVSRIVLYGGPGDDVLLIGAQVATGVWLVGGPGNDSLQALGSGPSLLLGGEGNDQLQGGAGRSIVIGGLGADALTAGVGESILIGGTTDHDPADEAWGVILNEWRSTSTYIERVGHLQGTLPGGQNAAYLLNAQTVHDDAAADTLQGGGGMDWFFSGGSRPNRDQIAGKTRGEVLTTVAGASAAKASPTAAGLYDPASSTFYFSGLDAAGSAERAVAGQAAGAGSIAVSGDWSAEGSAGVGLYDPQTSTFYLTRADAGGPAEQTFGFGAPGAGLIPLVGDWNGDGRASVGVYDPKASVFYLTDTLHTGFAEYTFGFGVPGAGWIPVVGDWNGDGQTGVGLYDPKASVFYLTETLQTGFADWTFGYGQAGGGWQPVVGDWNGDGAAGVGLYDPHASRFYLTNALATGCAEHTFGYGAPSGGWKPMVGDWNGDGRAGVGLYAPSSSTWYLTNSLATGYAQQTIGCGRPGAGGQPVVACLAAGRNSLTAQAVDQVDLAALARSELEQSHWPDDLDWTEDLF